MYIIKMHGGLGNQMFQYALYLKMQSLGVETKADLTDYNLGIEKKRKFELEDRFNVSVEQASEDEIKELYALNSQRVKRFFVKRMGSSTYYREPVNELKYRKEIFGMNDGYLDGYWQSEKYFFDIKKMVRQAFSNNALEKNSQLSDTVAIHVRLGDYLDNQDIYGGICTQEYYHNAIKYISGKIDSPRFYLFSDDIEKAKKMVTEKNRIKLFCSDEIPGIDDMEKISNCEHQIIANSSYSWWGAWMNDNPNKIVIAPKRWLCNCENDDVVPAEWIRM